MTQEMNQHPGQGDYPSPNSPSRVPASDPMTSAEAERAGYSQTTPIQPNQSYPSASNHAAGGANQNGSEESPDLLRWRADTLLDEMMMGGADDFAAHGAESYPNRAQGDVSSYSHNPHTNGQSGHYDAASYPPETMDYGEGPAHDGRPHPESLSADYPSAEYLTAESSHLEQPPVELPSENPQQPTSFERSVEHSAGQTDAPNGQRNQDSQPTSKAGPSQVNQASETHSPSHQAPEQHASSTASPPLAQFPGDQREVYSPDPAQQQDSLVPHSAPAQSDTYAQPTAHEQHAHEQHAHGQQAHEQQSSLASAPDPYGAPGEYRNPGQPATPGNYPAQRGQPPSNLRQPTAAQLAPQPQYSSPPVENAQGQAAPAYFPQTPQNVPSSHEPTANQLTANQPAANQPPAGQSFAGLPSMGQPPAEQPPAGQPPAWANQPTFEQGYAPQPNAGYQNAGYQNASYSNAPYPSSGADPRLGSGRNLQDRNQQPMDPATYYAQQIAWRRELERKQWAISSGSSSDYLTSVPRYEEAQNRTANYMDRLGASQSWQQNDPYGAHHPSDGYGPNGYMPRDPAAYSAGQGGIHANPNYSPQLGPVNPGYGGGYAEQQSRNMPFAERMDVGAQAQRRSNLLPRRSQMSVDALYEEMTVLQAQVDAALPIYGDSADRALHLLEKGRAILEHNPERSAEVAYYVQQVSGIIQRGQQRIEWSNLYRNRLSRYLTAWAWMGLLSLIGSLAYGDRVANALAGLFPSAAGFFGNHIPTILLAISAGIIGTSVAALVNMWRHSQKEYGFFDRKYGLLGVVLPLMGIVAALAIYAVMAIIYLFLNVSPSTNWIAHILPALFALIYGSSQERIYGTSE